MIFLDTQVVAWMCWDAATRLPPVRELLNEQALFISPIVELELA